jgi:hypothetical protein
VTACIITNAVTARAVPALLPRHIGVSQT